MLVLCVVDIIAAKLPDLALILVLQYCLIVQLSIIIWPYGRDGSCTVHTSFPFIFLGPLARGRSSAARGNCCGFLWGCHQICPLSVRLIRLDLFV